MKAPRQHVNHLAFTAKTAVVMRDDRRALRRFVRNDTLDPGLLLEQQDAAAMALARHAFRTTHHYRTSFTEAGIQLGDLDDPRTWPHLPVLEKDDLRRHADRLVSDERPDEDRLPSSTGGSTGRPLTVFNDRSAPLAAMWWRVYRWWGVRPSDDSALIYRIKQTPAQQRRERLEWWPTRTIRLDARSTTPEVLTHFVEQWRRTRPVLLNGYVAAVHEFARHVSEHDVVLPRPRAIAVTASMLHRAQRDLIESHLGAPVHDCYRSAEVPWIAAQCSERRGLHVLADARRVEVLDGQDVAGAGENGDLVVTDLTNHAFPLLRYRIGDRASLDEAPCRCGRTLPLMSAVQGRVVDVLRTPSGRTLSGGLSLLLDQHADTLDSFQVHQRPDYVIVVRYVPRRESGIAEVSAAEARITGELRRMLGDEVAVVGEQVDSIPHTGGKTRLVVSEVP